MTILKVPMPMTLKGIQKKIAEEVPYIDIKPYSHNIISCYLKSIMDDFGIDVFNETLEKFDLEEKGWRKIKMIEEPKGEINTDNLIKIHSDTISCRTLYKKD